MIRAVNDPVAERAALRRRVRSFYKWLDREEWEKCFALIDPQLRDKSRVERSAYAESLQRFRGVYGGVHPWYMRISIHLDGSSNKRDPRPFAYVYVVWQDDARGFHMFRERWVKDEGRWYTRVVGLVAKSAETTRGQ